jgi:hypothetical protein
LEGEDYSESIFDKEEQNIEIQEQNEILNDDLKGFGNE